MGEGGEGGREGGEGKAYFDILAEWMGKKDEPVAIDVMKSDSV